MTSSLESNDNSLRRFIPQVAFLGLIVVVVEQQEVRGPHQYHSQSLHCLLCT